MTLGEFPTMTWPAYVGPPATTSAPARFHISRSPQTLPAEHTFWTWREAIEVASRAGSKATVRKKDGRWVVRYRMRLVAMN